MSAGPCNLICERYATFGQTITYKDSSGNAINLTGYTAKMKIVGSDGSTLATLTDSSGITLGGSAGTIVLAISAATTTTFTPGTYTYDLLLDSSGGVITRLIEGSFLVISGVTTIP